MANRDRGRCARAARELRAGGCDQVQGQHKEQSRGLCAKCKGSKQAHKSGVGHQEDAKAKGRPKQQHNLSQGQAKDKREGEGNTGRSALHFIVPLGVVQVFLKEITVNIVNTVK